VSRREALLSAGLVFVVALAVRAWAMTEITFPRPEDVAYYVGVARNLVEGRGLVSDAIWSFNTPPLAFPRPAFEVWLPLPSFLAAIPMAVFGPSFDAAQLSSVVVGSIVCVLAWWLAADVAAARALPVGRARTLALGTGLTTAVYLPLVLASAQPDSTMPFAALVLLACLLIARLQRAASAEALSVGPFAGFRGAGTREARNRALRQYALGLVLGVAALTRNEALWLALTYAILEWRSTGVLAGAVRVRSWLVSVAGVAVVALLVFLPWALRDWVVFGTPFPGQALTNALFLDGRDVFAWQDQPTLARYLAIGVPKLLELRIDGTLHNLLNVLLLLGVPLSVVGVVGLPGAWRSSSSLRPLMVFSAITFAVASLLFPVATTWGTFFHAAGAIHVLLVISALLVLDALIGWVGRRRGWTRPVAWLGPTFAVAGCLLFSGVLLAQDGRASRDTAAHFGALAVALRDPSFEMPIDAEPGPIITDVPIWLAESTRHSTLALPNEPADSILDLARTFDPPARLLLVSADNTGLWPATILAGNPGADCFVPLPLPPAVDDVLAFRIRCP
jgi:hypothetical protein